jgi:hypothetical protein
MLPVLNALSIAATFIFGVGLIYLVLDATIGKIKVLHSKFEWNGLQIKDFVFLAVGAGIIIFCTSFVTPY